MRVLLVRVAALALLVGCHAAPPAPKSLAEIDDSDYPGVLLPPSAFPADVLLRQHVTATWGDKASRGFDAVFQRQGDTLTLLGLSPLGSVGFVVQLSGDRISFENRTAEQLPFPARFILLDVERIFFPWLATGGAALSDGTHEGRVGDELVIEVWADGRLVERRFTRLDGQPAGTISIRCSGTNAGRHAPEHAVLENDWLGYRLAVDTLEETLLDGAAP